MCHRLVADGALDGVPVAWGSPTYKNLGDDWRTLVNSLAPVTVRKSEQDKRIEIIGGGTVEMWSLDNPEPIRGRYYGRFIINEAASVSNLGEIFNEIVRPTLIDLHGDAYFPSTPKGRNDYYKLYNLGKSPDHPEWASFHRTSYDNPYLDPEEIASLKDTLSQREYRQEILAEFLEGEGTVFAGLASAIHAPITVPEAHVGHVTAMGVDWGKQDDFTAISIGCVDCEREVAIDRFNQIDYHYQTLKLQHMYKRWDVKLVVAELNAMGEPLVEKLQRDGLKVEGFSTTRVSKAPLIESLALAIETGEIQLINDDVWTMELEAYERTPMESTVKYSAPAGMHDDTVMARALMYRAMQHAPRAQRNNDATLAAMRAMGKIGR